MDILKEADEPNNADEATLQAVKELPEEEECDNSTRFTTISKSHHVNRNRVNQYYTIQEPSSHSAVEKQKPEMHLGHGKCVSTKLDAKTLSDDPEDQPFPRSELRKRRGAVPRRALHSSSVSSSAPFQSLGLNRQSKAKSFATKSQHEREETDAVLSFIERAHHDMGAGSGPDEPEVTRVVDIDGEDLAAPLSQAKIVRRNAVLDRRGKYSQSLILPHSSDDPAVDSEDRPEERKSLNSTSKVRSLCKKGVEETAWCAQEERVDNVRPGHTQEDPQRKA